MGSEKLRVVDGAAAGKEIPLDAEFVVGRGESGMGNLSEDPEISRRHSRFGRGESGALIATGTPRSAPLETAGSMGICAIKGAPIWAARAAPPPEPKIA